MPPISQRTQELGTEHAFVVLAEVNKLVAEGRKIISFAIGQPDFVTPGTPVIPPRRGRWSCGGRLPSICPARGI